MNVQVPISVIHQANEQQPCSGHQSNENENRAFLLGLALVLVLASAKIRETLNLSTFQSKLRMEVNYSTSIGLSLVYVSPDVVVNQ